MKLLLGVVWNETKQTGLIDSMLGNYFIPPIIFGERNPPDVSYLCSILFTWIAVSVDQQRNELRTCIDGKQRLTSIKRCATSFSEITLWDNFISL